MKKLWIWNAVDRDDGMLWIRRVDAIVWMKWILTDGMELTYRVDAIVWMLRGGPEQMVCRGYDSMVAIASMLSLRTLYIWIL